MHEMHDKSVVDIQEEVLYAEQENDMWVLLNRNLIKLIVKNSLVIYSKYVTINSKGKGVLYVELKI